MNVKVGRTKEKAKTERKRWVEWGEELVKPCNGIIIKKRRKKQREQMERDATLEGSEEKKNVI